MIIRSHKVFSCRLLMLQLPALEGGCVAINWSLGTAQSTATCRPVNETFQNHFPKWDVCNKQCFSRNRSVKCLTLTFDLFQVQSIKCSRCPTHVFKQDKCKSSHQPIYITKERKLPIKGHMIIQHSLFIHLGKKIKKTIFTRFEGNFDLKNWSKLGTNLLQIILRAL